MLGRSHQDLIIMRFIARPYFCLMLLNTALIVNVGGKVHREGTVIFNPALEQAWFYCGVIF